MNLINRLAILLCISVLFTSYSCKNIKSRSNKPENIILMIGDGMGVTHVYAGLTANGGSLNLERFTHSGFQKTYSANRYTTDSGASGTALATGTKTLNSAIGIGPEGDTLKNIIEYAEEAGLSTGVIATSTITHATPASFVAHNRYRSRYEEIALDFLDAGLELFIGGGWSHFITRKDGRDLIQELESAGYTFSNELEDIYSSSDLPLGILTDSAAMPPAQSGRGDLLPRATKTAIQLLSPVKGGFFLMIEGSQIDWAAHDGDTEYLTSEVIDFDESIGKALDFAIEDKNTLLIVTADHETGGFSIANGDIEKGLVEGSFSTDGHTGTMVPVFAYGPGASEFSGIYENTAIFDKMIELLDLR
jgi:alkaline phosphatase